MKKDHRTSLFVGMATLAALIVFTFPNNAEPPKPVAKSDLRQDLIDKGYIAVDVFRGKRGGSLYVKALCKRDREMILQIDTGSGSNCMHVGFATENKIPFENEGQTIFGIPGEDVKVFTARYPYISIGGVRIQRVNSWSVFDMSKLVEAAVENEGFGYDGLLGDGFLTNCGAVLDYENNKLYLLDPFVRDRALQGEWVSTQIEIEGKTTPTTDYKLGITECYSMLRIHDQLVTGTVQINVKKVPKEIDILSSDYQINYGSIYHLTKDKLVLSGPFRIDVVCNERPKEFKTVQDSKHAVVTFEKKK